MLDAFPTLQYLLIVFAGWVHRQQLDVFHLKRILSSYFDYYHRWRTHLGLAMDSPQVREIQMPDMGKVIEFADLGGLHHHYLRQAA